MSKTIEIAGETYQDVPEIVVPLSTSGTASFFDISSSTVTSGDMLSGVKAYNASGVEVTGTIQSKSSSDVSVSGDTVSIPAGNYSSSVTKTVAAGSATTPATTITLDPTITISSGGLITASYSGSQTVIPTVSAGYISSGVGGTVTVTGSKTSQLSTRSAQTIIPTTTDQTISSGLYLTGTQTIKGDANLIAANIAKDVTIFGVTGTHAGGGADCPIFTVSIDDDNGDILAINCDKTYSECMVYFNDTDDEITSLAIIDCQYYSNNSLVYEDISGANGTILSGSSSISYSLPDTYDGMLPFLQILYASSGAITFSEEPVTRRSSSDISTSGATVTVPAGYYSSNASIQFTVYDGSVT